MLDKQGYMHARTCTQIFNISCFSTATMISRTCLSVTLYLHCLSYSVWRNSPKQARAASFFLRFPDHTQWHTTVGWTPLDEGSAQSQRPLPDNTQHSQETDIHAFGGIRTRNHSKRSAATSVTRPLWSTRNIQDERNDKFCYLWKPQNIVTIRVMGWERRMEGMKKTQFWRITKQEVTDSYQNITEDVDRIGLKSCPDTIYHISAAGTLNSVNYLILQQKWVLCLGSGCRLR